MIAMLPPTAGASRPSGGSTTGMRSVANLSGPGADFPAAAARSCCESWRSETLNSRLSRMRRLVREPGCSAIAIIAGECDTYISVLVPHERSPPWAAAVMESVADAETQPVEDDRHGSR